MHAIKSRVHGSANLSVLMHQRQLLSFGSKFGIIPTRNLSSLASFTAEHYNSMDYAFLSKKGHRTLTNTQFKHLQQHYMTIHSIARIFDDPELVNMDRDIGIWHRCRVDGTVYHCKESQRRNSTRLNYLAWIDQQIDLNAHFSYKRRPENMALKLFYVYIQFYGVHQFHGQQHMVMYSECWKVDEHDGLVEDKGHHVFGFQDICVLDHLCARVPGAGGKVYFVDERETMEARLRAALGSR